MKAVVYHGANDLRLEVLPVPKISISEVLVKVAVCGVCPTDIKKIHYGTLPGPRVFGHETAGTIVKVGSAVKGWRPGDRVGLHHHVPCLHCHACQHHAFAQCPQYKRTGITAGFEPSGGGYAEYVRVLHFCLPGMVRIPNNCTFEQGALLEPVNTVLKGMKKLGLLPGDKVLVIGQGPIGLMFTRLLYIHGMQVAASDLLESRLQRAKEWGATCVVQAGKEESAGKLEKWAGKEKLDAVVLAVPSDAALKEAMAQLRGGGKVLLFAHTRRGNQTEIDLSNICVDEIDLLGSYSSDFLLQKEVAKLVFTRKIDTEVIVTHRFALEETASAISLAANPMESALKILVRVEKEA
ncbi:MAG: Alcohol dehydrogenase GroES domain protein [Verrucomicrobiales bacterium]|nr:Alcohol dehydrogenase GroES domain protein [Verrucomicrobiales bacterium]